MGSDFIADFLLPRDKKLSFGSKTKDRTIGKISFTTMRTERTI